MKTKRYLLPIEEILMAYPHLEIDGDELWNGEELVSISAKALIAEFYDNFDEFTPKGSDYIDKAFHGSYSDALYQISYYSNND